jgi:hypothetical protein
MISKASRINQQHGPPTDPALTEERYPRRSLPKKLHRGEFGAGVWLVFKIRGSREMTSLDKNYFEGGKVALDGVYRLLFNLKNLCF